MRPQDVVILLKIISLDEKPWRMKDVALALRVSASEVTESLELAVNTQPAEDRGTYTINFPLELDPCTDQPPQ